MVDRVMEAGGEKGWKKDHWDSYKLFEKISRKYN